jgi:hypothetical protein
MMPPLVFLAVIIVTIALVVLAWDGAGAATGEIQMRIFLVGWAVAAVVVLAGLLFARPVSHLGQAVLRSVPSMAVQHVAVGIVLGLAIGTTDWATLRLAGWWLLWWTIPLLLTYAGHLITLRGVSRTWP